MSTDTDIDIEIMDLGFNLGQYETALAVAAGMLARGATAMHTPETVALADDQASKLVDSIRRCDLSARKVHSATTLGTSEAIVVYINYEYEQFVFNIIHDVFAKWGSRREAIIIFAFHLARVIGGKQIGVPRQVHFDKMRETGRRFGLPEKTVDRWLNDPSLTKFDSMRKHLRQQASVKFLPIVLALVLSVAAVGLFLALVHLLPFSWVINHPSSYGVQATVSLLIACTIFGLLVQRWRKWLFGVAGLAFLGVLLQIM